jgi:Acetyl/propionyl-CoA carboxylase, alpha subunit
VDAVKGRPLEIRMGPHTVEVVLEGGAGEGRVHLNGEVRHLKACSREGDRWVLEVEGRPMRVRVHREGSTLWMHLQGRLYAVDLRPQSTAAAPAGRRADPLIRSPMTGKVIRVPVRAGDRVRAGEVVATVEAMKMEYHLEAPFDARVEAVEVQEGDLVDQDQVLVRLTPLEEAHAPD